MTERRTDLQSFVRGEADPDVFSHEEHVRMGFELLQRHDFAEAAHLYSRALRTMTMRAGQPQVFHQTITIAFLSLIAERIQTGSAADFAGFAANNPDLLDRAVLSRWYRAEHLATDIARRTFVLPEPRSG